MIFLVFYERVTDRRTNGPTDRWTDLVIEMRGSQNIIFKHPTQKGLIQIRHIEGEGEGEITSLTFSELVGKKVKKRFENFQIQGDYL